MAQRKNYPGNLRTPGTKDYSLILGNLMSYRNKLFREEDEQEIGLLFLKIAEKLKELGFKRAFNSVKMRAGRRKLGKFRDITPQKKEEVIEIALKYWEAGKKKHDEAKEKKKS